MANTVIQEPNDLDEGYLTDETAKKTAVLVYTQDSTSAGIKRIGIAPWKSYLDYDHYRTKNLATLVGFTESEYDKGGKAIDPPDETLKQQLQNLSDKVGLDIHTPTGTIPETDTLKYKVTTLQTTVGGTDSGLVKGVADNKKSIEDLQKAIGSGGSGDKNLSTRVGLLENTVGDSTKGLVKSVADNTTNIATNTSNITSVTSRVTTLEGVVGSTDSGLVKDVNTLKTTVGDDTTGLVKDVVDCKSSVSTMQTDVTTLKTTVGDSDSGLVKQVETNRDDITKLKSSVTTAYKYQGDITDQNEFAVKTNDCKNIGEEANGYVYNITATEITDGDKTYKKGANIAWVYDSLKWDELGTAIDVKEVEDLKTSVSELTSSVEKINERYVNTAKTTTWTNESLTDGIYLVTAVKSLRGSTSVGMAIMGMDNSQGMSFPFTMISGTVDDFFTVDENKVTSKTSVSITTTRIN